VRRKTGAQFLSIINVLFFFGHLGPDTVQIVAIEAQGNCAGRWLDPDTENV
jgi:hypothetical protein